MQFGAIYPQIELGGDPAALRAFALAAERLGYDYLLMFDHVAGAVRADRPLPLFGPYSDRDPFHDPLVAFGFIAGITERIGLATGIMVLPQRQTLLVARQAADVDLFSGGRLRLGVGVGWNYVEYDALGQDFATRGARLDEQIPYLRRLWEGTPLSFAGRFDRIDRAAINPPPTRRIPIYGGGLAPPALHRAARLTDGFVFSGGFEERILPAWAMLRDFLAEEGRDIASFGAEYLISQACPIAEVIDIAGRWHAEGGTHLGVRTMGLGFTEVGQHIDYLAEARQRLGRK